jgi:hypothetical protein
MKSCPERRAFKPTSEEPKEKRRSQPIGKRDTRHSRIISACLERNTPSMTRIFTSAFFDLDGKKQGRSSNLLYHS